MTRQTALGRGARAHRAFRRLLGGLVVAALLAGLAVGAPSASAAVPARTDVLFVFDTTGSMRGALEAARDKVDSLLAQIDGQLPDVQYGLAEVGDHPIYADPDDEPYRLRQGITNDRAALKNALEDLEATGGGDNPEAYGTALLAADLGNGGVGWRPGARRLVVLVADELPHDDDLNADIPDDLQIESSPFGTGIDPGFDGAIGTTDDVDWQPLLTRMANDGIPLLYVLFEGPEKYLPYWKLWAGRTGGAATDADDDDLDTKVVALATAAATGDLPPCPTGQSRDASGVCGVVAPVAVPAPTPAAPAPAPTTNPFANVWTTIRDGYNAATPCDGEADDVGKGWKTLGKAALCVGSGKVFFDDALKGKAGCIVDIGASIIPVGKLLAAGKVAKKFADEAKDTVKALRKLKLSAADKRLVDRVDDAGTAWSLVSAGSVPAATMIVIQKLLTSRDATGKLVKILNTSHNSTAIKHLKRTQELASGVFTAISGIDDAVACKKAFFG